MSPSGTGSAESSGPSRAGLGNRDPGETTNALLELDRSVWKAQQDLEASVVVSEAREVFRDLIVQFGMTLEASPLDRRECLAPLVEKLLEVRSAFREESSGRRRTPFGGRCTIVAS